MTYPDQNSDSYQILHDLWLWLFDGDPVKAAPHKDRFQAVLESYSEPQRFYHTAAHLLDFAAKIDRLKLKDEFTDLKRAAAFIFYHDFVYRTDTIDNIRQNEELSAQRAEKELLEMGIPADIVASAAALIRATKTHQIDAEADPEGALLIDLDMSILGAEPAEYDAYTRAVRREYSFFDDVAFYTARRDKFILPTLARSTPIFKTQMFRDIYEEKARDNLRRELRDIDVKLNSTKTPAVFII